MSETNVSVAGTTIHVDDTGEVGLDPVVCLHSLFFNNQMFDALIEAGRGQHRFIRPEFRGQARSAPADSATVTMEQAAGDTAAVMDALGISGAQIVASSMGGDVAARLSAYRPDLVSSLVFVGSSVRAEPVDKVDEYVAWSIDSTTRGFDGDRLDFLQHVMFGVSTLADPQKKDMVDHWTAYLRALPPALLPAMLGVMKRGDATPLLAHVDVPAIVISGEECPVRPPDWAAALAAALPESKLVMVARCGHSPLLEQPDDVIPQVLEFLAAGRSVRRS